MIKSLGVSEVTYYRWRKGYSRISVVQAKRLNELEKENQQHYKTLRPHGSLKYRPPAPETIQALNQKSLDSEAVIH